LSPGLRYGYVTNGLTDHRLDDALGLLADCGYDGVALTLDHVHFDPFAAGWRDRAADLRGRVSDLGLDCVVETGARFALDRHRKHFPNLLTDGRERRIELLQRAIDIAAELGAPVVSLWSGAPPDGLDPATAWERLRDGCQRVVGHAEEREIALGFEPEPGMLVERLDDFDRLAHDLGHPRALGLTLDLGHCVCVEPQSVAECVRRTAPWLVHVHADDMRRGVHEHLMFGEGELDLPAALGALAEIVYGGMVAVELSRHAHRANDTVPAAIAALRAADPDAPPPAIVGFDTYTVPNPTIAGPAGRGSVR
jgi:L-ribulose-5-phosphate 3-epimerase